MTADLQRMALGRGSLEAHAPAAGAEAVARARAAAEPLSDARIVHVSSAGAGGRVPELLGALLPLAVDAGLRVEWLVLFGDRELQATASALHDGLQGAESALDEEAWRRCLEDCGRVARTLPAGADAVVLHDPGTLGLAVEDGGPTIWRCHLDASEGEGAALELAAPLARRCRALVFADPSFAPADLRGEPVHAAAPGIDPLSPRNADPVPRLAGRLLRPLGVDLSRPFVCQAMRLDRWKDPHGTIDAFALAKEEVPELQLVLAAALDSSEPVEWRAAKELRDYAAERPDLHVLTSYEGIGNLELGTLQRLARVALQRSLREGFGLAVSEALWKRTPVVGNPGGGTALQLRDGVDGHLAAGVEDTAARIVDLVRDPGLAVEMGRAGRERVRERFLTVHALERELRALAGALKPPEPRPEAPGAASGGASVERR